jgi:uncharacterized protein YcfJ
MHKKQRKQSKMSNITKGLTEAFGRYDRRDAYQRDYDSSVAGMGKRQSQAYQADGGANDEGWDEPQRDYTPKPVAKKGFYFYKVPADQDAKAQEVGLFRTKSGKWYSPFQNTRADMFFGPGKYWEPKTNESQLSELSNDTLASYKKKAGADATASDKTGDTKKADKRFSGIVRATKKEFDNDAKGVAEGWKGATIGGAIGYHFGNHYAAMLGATIGHLIGELVGKIGKSIKNNKEFIENTKDITTSVSNNILNSVSKDKFGFPQIDLGELVNIEHGNVSPELETALYKEIKSKIEDKLIEKYGREQAYLLKDKIYLLIMVVAENIYVHIVKLDKKYKEGVSEEKQRLDPSCWKGYKKQGTKMKGDTRVNNCVPVKESAIMKGLK